MTVPSAKGLPHSLVSKDRRRSSPVLIDSVSRWLPGAGSKPARAALPRASAHAAVLAAKPSGLELRWRVKSEYSDGKRALSKCLASPCKSGFGL